MISQDTTRVGADPLPKPRGDRRSRAISTELADGYAALLRDVQSQQAMRGESCFAVGFASCGPDKGASALAVNFAGFAASDADRRVLLVDADARGTVATKLLNKQWQHGLTDALVGAALVGDCVQPTKWDGLSFLPAGSREFRWGPDYDHGDVANLLAELKSEYDLIVFDLPPVEDASETYAFAELLSGIYLAIRAGRAEARHVRQVRQRLERGRTAILGAICIMQS